MDKRKIHSVAWENIAGQKPMEDWELEIPNFETKQHRMVEKAKVRWRNASGCLRSILESKMCLEKCYTRDEMK